MTPKDRLVKAIKLEKLDRPPITCFNQTVTLEQMENVGKLRFFENVVNEKPKKMEITKK